MHLGGTGLQLGGTGFQPVDGRQYAYPILAIRLDLREWD